jgi:hypothetical protein
MKPLPVTRFYQVRVAPPRIEWARIWITDDGCISILSDYGNYGYWFGGLPECGMRQFLAHAGDDYLLGKFSGGKRELDEKATKKAIEDELQEAFGSGDDLDRELSALRDVDLSNPIEHNDWMRETELDWEIIYHGGLFKEQYPQQVMAFMKELWPLFRERLNAELERESLEPPRDQATACPVMPTPGLETAAAFERRLREGNESPLPRIMRIERRDRAMNIAMLDELEGVFLARARTHTVSDSLRYALETLRAKYAEPDGQKGADVQAPGEDYGTCPKCHVRARAEGFATCDECVEPSWVSSIDYERASDADTTDRSGC